MSTTRSEASQLADTVRESLEAGQYVFPAHPWYKAQDALAALVELAESGQEWEKIAQEKNGWIETWRSRAEEAERERDRVVKWCEERFAEAGREAAEELDVSVARAAKLEAALDAIRRNAEAWHGDGRAQALDVIATWAADPDSIPAALLVSAGRDEQETT